MPVVHLTAVKNLEGIACNGLREKSYFIDPEHGASEALIDYYAETIRDEGDEPVILLISESALDATLFEADRPGIEEPITTALGMSDADVNEEWQASGQTAMDSRRIIGSFRYAGTIPPDVIRIAQDGYDSGEPLIVRRPAVITPQWPPGSVSDLAARP